MATVTLGDRNIDESRSILRGNQSNPQCSNSFRANGARKCASAASTAKLE
jgi:hypothetical protein